jgi:hypothetical protein
MWGRRILCQKTSAPRCLKTDLRQPGQSIPPKQNDIEQNIIMDAVGSPLGP